MLKQQVTMSPPTGHLRKQSSPHNSILRPLSNAALNKISALPNHQTLKRERLVSATESA